MKLVTSVLLAALALPIAASAHGTTTARATIDATQLPDTTYRVVVYQVPDTKHIEVTMQNGALTTLTAGRPAMDFSSVHQGDTLMLSTYKGTVLVFKDFGPAPKP